MKKRILAAALVGSMLLGGAVAAAGTSIWGSYKGNDIVRINVDGTPVKVNDVPAISYNNRTMVPIYLLKQAGIDYAWDEKNKTVNVNSAKSNNNSKTYVQYADIYYSLETISEDIKNAVTLYDQNATFIIYNSSNTEDSLASAKSNLDLTIKEFNVYLGTLGNMRNDYSISPILTDIQSSVDNAVEVDKQLNSYLKTKTSDVFQKYSAASKNAYTYSTNAKKAANQKFNYYMSLLYNTK